MKVSVSLLLRVFFIFGAISLGGCGSTGTSKGASTGAVVGGKQMILVAPNMRIVLEEIEEGV